MNKKWLWLASLGIVAFGAGVWLATPPLNFKQLRSQDSTEKTILAKIVSAKPGYIIVDKIEWFSGEEARIAMRHDGACPDEECYPPNDYYIRNSSLDQAEYRVSPEVEVLMQTWSHDADGNYNWNQPILFTDLVSKLGFYSQLPFHITLRGDSVIKIVEQYIP